jgi:hypothetical protein
MRQTATGRATPRSPTSSRQHSALRAYSPAIDWVASLTTASLGLARSAKRAATLTALPYQSPSRMTAGPVWAPTRTGRRSGRVPTSVSVRSTSLTADPASGTQIMAPSPIDLTCQAPC